MNQNRREFIGTTLMTFIAAKMGAIEPGRAFEPLKQIDAGVLNCTAGPTTSTPTSTSPRSWRRRGIA